MANSCLGFSLVKHRARGHLHNLFGSTADQAGTTVGRQDDEVYALLGGMARVFG